MPIPFNADLFERFLVLHAGGRTIRSICLEDWAPDPRTFYRWKDHSSETLQQFQEARQAYSDALAEQIIEISDGKGDPQRDKLRCENRRWLASKSNPERYGDKVEIGVSHKLDLGAALAAAQSRLSAPNTIELTANPDPDDEDEPYPDFLD